MRQAIDEKRCAVYTRKSTDERLDAEFNSLEAQYDSCAAYIKSQTGLGWTLLGKHYDDGGYSGGTRFLLATSSCFTTGNGSVSQTRSYVCVRLTLQRRYFVVICENNFTNTIDLARKF